GGIALAFAMAGSTVTMVARRQATLDRACRRHEGSIRLLTETGLADAAGAAQTLGRITGTIDLEQVSFDADLVVESIAEDLAANRALYRAVEPRLGPSTILGTCTSVLPLSILAAALVRPERFIGYHWFNPAELVALVEIVPAERTAPEVA